MENFFKNLQKIGEVCAAVAEEIERNENRARQRVADEAFEEQLPRPSAPSYTNETIDEQLASLSSVSSGYGSGCSSSQSSRRSSNFSIDETWDVARYNPPAAAAPAGSPPRRPPRDPPITPGQALLAAVAAGAVVAGAVYVGKALSAKEAVLVATFTECETISKKIKKDAQQYPVVGLDCQWVQWGTRRSRVALLQLWSANGNIALIQLHKIGRIPGELRDILADRKIIKAGIETLQDAKYLEEDYGLMVQGTFDLRFLARDTNHHPGGLKRLAKDILSVDIGQDAEIMASDWEQDPLSDEQVTYAEAAVKASFDIFQKLIHEMFWISVLPRAQEYVKPMLDKKFRQ